MDFGSDGSAHHPTIGVGEGHAGDLHSRRAHWVSRDTIVWPVASHGATAITLHFSYDAAMKLRPAGIEGGEEIPLRLLRDGPPAEILDRFPHLRGLPAFVLETTDDIATALRSELAVSARDAHGVLIAATGIQIPGVLDDVYRYDGELGVCFRDGVPTLRVWAPTARSVALYRFADAAPDTPATVEPMQLDAATGVWSVQGTRDWTGCFYLYEVEVWAPTTAKVEHNLVTDPYSISLATNSTRSQIVDLDDATWMPPGWRELRKPELAAPEDIVLYELHVRDFSITDGSVPQELRGSYRAFAEPESHGMQHLRGLAEAGLTHIHLLPVFDFATVDEDPTNRVEPDPAELATFPPDSEAQQAAIAAARDQDGFNWGYDPFHYTTPEGSYATEPNGAARIREFRTMVQALNNAGLRVVMDVVYNHTTASGQHDASVLDKVVPGYYHRLNAWGDVENSTCCQNTATEHAMMEKLMVDSLRTWATAYKIDGFRFDLMGHHMVANMVKVRDTLAALTPERDGVDGSAIYLYGEGWNFGEVANGARGRNAIQAHMAGTGIGTFSDRLRDAVRGGSPFSGIHEQGFATGLFTAPNDANVHNHGWERDKLLLAMDQIRVGLAGNLAGYRVRDRYGHEVTGREVPYNGSPTGYTTDPQEVINYVEAHDNETLWDIIQIKAPGWLALERRVQMQMLANSIVALAQGVPFFHAGQDLLRSKSLDRNSYNSGDWFNRLDWSYASNNWGVGLPPGENQVHWPLMRPLLANPALRVGRAEIEATAKHFQEMLRIRKSSSLFRLRTAAEIQQQLQFLNTGPEQIPGLIVMQLRGDDGPFREILVAFNSTLDEQRFGDQRLAEIGFKLHPVQATGISGRGAKVDRGTFVVPPLATAVFVAAASDT